jgi:hypothetical protein
MPGHESPKGQNTTTFHVLVFIGGMAVYLLLGGLVYLGLNAYIQPNALGDAAKEATARKDLFQALALIMAGVAGIVGVYFTWRNLRFLQESTQENLRLLREGQVTERFTRAIEQLAATKDSASKNLEMRMGGIYALERIARDSQRDHWSIMQVLTAYIRENAPWSRKVASDSPEQTPADIQAILDVLKNRVRHYQSRETGKNYSDDPDNPETHRLHLAKTDLRKAYLRGTRLEGASLRGATLEDALLNDACLQEAWLQGACLRRVKMNKATNLMGAVLDDSEVQNLDLKFGAADLEKAEIKGVDLRGVIGLTQDQIDSAIGDDSTMIPDNLYRPESWKTHTDGQ